MDSLVIGIGLAVVVVMSLSGTIAAQLAVSRRRQPILWFVYGAVLGPIGGLLVWLSPPASCPRCGTPTRGWESRCLTCGTDARRTTIRGPLTSLGPVRARRLVKARRSVHPAVLRSVAGHAMATAGWAADVDDVRAPAIGRAAQPEVRTASAAVGERARRAAAAPSPRSGLAGVTVAGGRRPVAQAVGQGTGGLVERGHEAAAVLPPTIPAILPATAAVPHPAVPNPEPVATEAEGPLLLATGVFIGGTAGLIVGARYAIVRAGTDFRVLGPLDSAPDAVAVHRPLDELDPLAVDDRCVIAQRSDPGRALIAMRGIAGLTGEGLEAGLRPGVPPGEAAS